MYKEYFPAKDAKDMKKERKIIDRFCLLVFFSCLSRVSRAKKNHEKMGINQNRQPQSAAQ
jgi:hypothetical protein